MIRSFSVFALSAVLAGAAAGGVAVNGSDIAAGAGDGWTYAAPVVSLAGPGPFVVSGADVAGGTVLRAEADCAVVASNLVLSASGTGTRARADGLALASSFASDGAGNAVACFSDGLWRRGGFAFDALRPADPATATGKTFLPGDGWEPTNVSWEPAATNSAVVAWTGERFVAARFRGGFLVSEDGAEWRPAAWNGTPDNLRAVARSGADGTLVAASTQGLWTSADGGLSWSQATNLYANAVVWADGLFVAAGELRGAATEGVYWSADGAHWTARGFSDFASNLSLLVAFGGGSGRFLAAGANGCRALRFEGETLADSAASAFSGSKFSVAAGGGRCVACFLADTGLRWSDDGLSWTRSDKKDGTFPSIIRRDGRFFAEGYDAAGAYAGLWTSEDGKSWTPVADGWEPGRPALDCGAHMVKLSVFGADNALAGGLYAPAVRVALGGSLDVSAQSASPAVLAAAGGRWAAAIGGGMDESAGAFVQRGATLFADGGYAAPDVGPGAGGQTGAGATILGGSLRPGGYGFFPAPSNGVEAVRCVVVDGFAPGAAVELANLPAGYGTDGIAADADGRVWLWLPAAADSFRFIAGGTLRRVAAGGGACPAETLPDPAVEAVSFAAGDGGALEVTLRVSSPVEAEALAPAFATDLSALASGGGETLAPSRVEQIADGEYALTFRLPDAGSSGFLVIRAK